MYEDAGVPGHDDLRHRYKEIAAAVRAMAQAVFAHNQKAIQAKLAEAITDSASGDKVCATQCVCVCVCAFLCQQTASHQKLALPCS